jgi:hypothetical protein
MLSDKWSHIVMELAPIFCTKDNELLVETRQTRSRTLIHIYLVYVFGIDSTMEDYTYRNELHK